MGRKSPQEKKRLSYAKDRRNRYGENDKSSRKNIPRHKRRVNRANRHREQQVLNGARGPADIESLLKTRPQRWQKSAGVTLGALVQGKLAMTDERRVFEAETLSPLSDDELGELLSAAVHLLPLRYAAILHLLYYAGLRATELSALALRDVSADAVIVRGPRQRTVPIPPELRPLLDAYLRERVDEGPTFFLSDTCGRPVPPATVNSLVVIFGFLIGLPGLSARTLRKTFAVNLLRAGVDLDDVAAMLGHASPEATRAYLAS
ncbi:tyrosine-type recombinase/integrase [Amycolatopsis roodepoortensis]|uniref:Integrase n=1 Tax=Amycolatopsis roodepoortensis TaxID=700274 RepID=A0ABR9L1D3_9PSEU|nr:site-specific integrase [Amycolatopsis roodepoortensis]MBE1573987.1 integrase [Amycolatopsis roodepoortensis]